MATPINETPTSHAAPTPPEANGIYIERLWNNREALLAKGIEPTLNRRGCTYHIFGEQEKLWLSSLPSSPLPLLDVGACYGVQTIHALSNQRDVIALDACEDHLTILRQRVAKLPYSYGKLVDTVCTKLPDKGALPPDSVSGILCSEVAHFLKPGEMRPLFEHFCTWLCPGGRLVLTAGAWQDRIQTQEKAGFKLLHGRTADDLVKMLETMPPAEIVDAAPGFVYLPEQSPWIEKIGESLYHLSTVELRELATSAGLEVEDVKLYSAGKYDDASGVKETVMLVARKPE